MVYGAIDLHARRSEIRVIDEDGRVVRETRVVTERTALAGAFAALGPVRIVVEAGTESTWVAETLEAAGHTVVVVDPNYAPMYGEWHRKVKTDRRDVTALAEANRRGWYRAVHRVSAEQRAVRQVLRSRRQLVQMRAGAISLTRALLRQVGMRLGRGTSETVATRVRALALPTPLGETLAPVLRVLDTVTEAIATLEAQVRTAVAPDPVVKRLVTVPGVGLIVAATFRAVVDDVGRFASAAQVSAALGLVPREDSSAERRHRGHITKAGPRELRSLLVQAAWACWRSGASGTLRAWADRVAGRRGKRVAVVGLARRLSRILYAMWRDDRPFDAARLAAA
jgi:transposase